MADWLDDSFGLPDVGVNGATVDATARKRANFIAGSNVTITGADNPGTDSVDVTINAPGSGITQLTGDGTAGPGSGSQALVVVKINGTSVPATPTAGQALVATGGTAASWSAPGGDLSGTFASTTVSRVNGIAVSGTPSTGYVLTATSSSAATWQVNAAGISQLTSDVLAGPGSGSQAATVVSLTGSGGFVTVNATLQWLTGATSPLISQADDTTASSTAQNLEIQAQNATGSGTCTGGQLNLRSGTGSDAAHAGTIALGCGSDNSVFVYPKDSNGTYRCDWAGSSGHGTTDYDATLQTTGATPVASLQFSAASNTAYDIQFTVVARNTSTGDAWRADFADTIKNVSGTVTEIGSLTGPSNQKNDSGLSALSVSTQISGTNWAVVVTGIAATTINWSIVAQLQIRS